MQNTNEEKSGMIKNETRNLNMKMFLKNQHLQFLMSVKQKKSEAEEGKKRGEQLRRYKLKQEGKRQTKGKKWVGTK